MLEGWPADEPITTVGQVRADAATDDPGAGPERARGGRRMTEQLHTTDELADALTVREDAATSRLVDLRIMPWEHGRADPGRS